MVERRRFPRHRVFKGASIAFGRSAAISCTVRNLSEGGACLDVECPIGIPDDFALVMDADRSVRRSRIVWTSARRLGVAFH